MIYYAIPAFNEEESLAPLAREISSVMRDVGQDFRIIIVDDGSTDSTASEIDRLTSVFPIVALRNEHNLGLGRTMDRALRKAAELSSEDDVVVTMDGDGTHSPAFVPALLRNLREGADVAIASRYAPGGEAQGVPAHRRLLSAGAGTLLKMCFPIKGVRDYSGGYRAYRAATLNKAFSELGAGFVTENGFAVMAEILLKLAKSGADIREVPFVLRYDLKRGESKIRIGRTVLRYLQMISKLKAADLFTPVNLALVLIVALAGLLRVYRLGEAFGGYFAYNEAFYATLAAKYLPKGLLSVVLSPLDYKNPPLYALLLVASLKLFGVGEAVARSVSVAAGLLSVIFIFKLGRVLFGRKAALVAATVLAFSPGYVLVSRNVQPDSVLVLLIIASAYYYVRGAGEGRPVLSAVSGGLLGLGLLTKLPAVLIVPAFALWEIWGHGRRRLDWITQPAAIAFAGAFAAIGLPWYAYQFLARPDVLVGSQSGLAATIAEPSVFFFTSLLIKEMYWMLSPPVFVVFLVSAVWMFVRRKPADILVLSLGGVYFLFYVFYHFHTYYLIPVTPFAALAVAAVVGAARPGGLGLKAAPWAHVTVVCAALAASSVLFSFLMLGGQKYGKAVFVPYVRANDEVSRTIGGDGAMMKTYGPVLGYYAKKANVMGFPLQQGQKPRDDITLILWRKNLHPKGVAKADLPQVILPQDEYRLVLFGYAVGQRPPDYYFFENGPIKVERVGPLSEFGVTRGKDATGFGLYFLSGKGKARGT